MDRADKRVLWRTILLASPLAIATGFVAGELSLPSPAPAYSQVRETPVEPPVSPVSSPPAAAPPSSPPPVPTGPPTPSVIPVAPIVDPGETPIPMFTTPPGVG